MNKLRSLMCCKQQLVKIRTHLLLPCRMKTKRLKIHSQWPLSRLPCSSYKQLNSSNRTLKVPFVTKNSSLLRTRLNNRRLPFRQMQWSSRPSRMKLRTKTSSQEAKSRTTKNSNSESRIVAKEATHETRNEEKVGVKKFPTPY